MPDNFTTLSATANCGNGSLGTNAIDKFRALLNEKKPDAFIINCQEARFADIKAELTNMLSAKDLKNYQVTQIGHMVTATDAKEATYQMWSDLNGPAGICTFIIHRKDINIKVLHQNDVRGVKNAWLPSSRKNKGGHVARIQMAEDQSKRAATLDLISAHYESFDVVIRAQDHSNVYLSQQTLVNNAFHKNLPKRNKGLSIAEKLAALSAAIPDQIFYGADTNVRDRFEPNAKRSIWQESDAIELTSLKCLPLTNHMGSAQNTFHHINKPAAKEKKRKDIQRNPLATSGRLDLNGHLTSLGEQQLVTEDFHVDVQITPEQIAKKMKARDHVIVFSKQAIPIITDGKNDFDKVKNYMSARLQYLRPKLAKSLEQLEHTEENSTFLISIYESYFNMPNNIIDQLLKTHQELLKDTSKLLKKERNPLIKKQIIESAINKDKRLWAEPTTSDYQKNLILYGSKTAKEKLIILDKLNETISNCEVISPYIIPRQVFSDIRNQVNDYHSSINQILLGYKKDTSLERAEHIDYLNMKLFIEKYHPDEESKSALYNGLGEYQRSYKENIKNYNKSKKLTNDEKNDITTQTFFRKKFIEYLKQHTCPIAIPSKEKSRLMSPKSGALSMKNFIGQEGIALFKLAMEEELNSKEFRDAAYQNCAIKVEGNEWPKRPIHYIAGPSSSGKSYQAKKLIAKIQEDLGISDLDGGEGNLMIQVDGGIIRQTSQMRKLLIKTAEHHGFTGIYDLQDKVPKGFSKLKEHIQECALKSDKKIGLIIPETFANFTLSLSPSKFGYHPSNEDFNALTQMISKKDSKLYFTRIMSTDEEEEGFIKTANSIKTHKKVVAFNGENRAFKNSTFEQNKVIDLNETCDAESKAYIKRNYFAGHFCSKKMENWIKTNHPDAYIMQIRDDRELAVSTDGSQRKFLISKRVIMAWQQGNALKTKLNITIRDKKLISYLYLDGPKTPNLLSRNDFSDKSLEDLASIYLANIPKDLVKASLEGFNRFLIKLDRYPPSIIKDMQTGRKIERPIMTFSPMHQLTDNNNDDDDEIKPHKIKTPKKENISRPPRHQQKKQPLTPSFFSRNTEEQIRNKLKQKMNIDIFNQEKLKTNLISEAFEEKKLAEKVLKFSAVGNLLQPEHKKHKHLEDLDKIIKRLLNKQKMYQSDIETINNISNTERAQFNHLLNKQLSDGHVLLKKEYEKYQAMIKTLRKLHEDIKDTSYPSETCFIGLSNMTTTIVDKKDISNQLNISAPIVDCASIKTTSATALPSIDNRKVALHQFMFQKEKLAFIESPNHDELTTVKSKTKKTPQAKAHLAFMMAQKFLMNFNGLPTISTPIYLRGKDLELVELIHASLQLMAEKSVLNFDIKSIQVISKNYKPSFNTDSKTLSKVTLIKQTINHELLKNITELSKNVNSFKTSVNESDPIDDIIDELSPLLSQ